MLPMKQGHSEVGMDAAGSIARDALPQCVVGSMSDMGATQVSKGESRV
jgi:hypothetical protein